MNFNIRLIIVLIAVTVFGLWYFLAGVNGWKYPRIEFEFNDDDKNDRHRIVKVIVGFGLMVVGIGGIITKFII